MTTSTVKHIDVPNAPGIFPMTALIETGVWASLTAPAKAVLGVLWEYHRQYPDACHPARTTIAREAGVSAPTVSRCLNELEVVGLVEVIPTSGPRPNTYILSWRDIRVQTHPRVKGGSPFKPSRQEYDTDLIRGADGKDETRITRRNAQTYRMADGCVVRSAGEMQIHSYLEAWKVPHWSDVRYIDLGIRIIDPKNGNVDTTSTVDFVVGPNVLMEKAGLASTQKGAKKYHEKLKRKLLTAKAAGWKVILVKPNQKPGAWLVDKIVERWSTATLENGELLKRQMEKAGKYGSGHKPSRWLDGHLEDARARRAGRKGPRASRGLTAMGTGTNGLPAEQVFEQPVVVLEEAAMPPMTKVASRSPRTFTFGPHHDEPSQIVGLSAKDTAEVRKLEADVEKLEMQLDDHEDMDEELVAELMDKLGEANQALAALRTQSAVE